MRKFLDALYFFGGLLAALCLLMIVGIILAQIAGRIFGFVIPSANNIAGFLMGGVIFLALAYSFREGSHIRVELVFQFLSQSKKRFINLLCLSVSIAVSSFMVGHFGRMMVNSWNYGDMSDGLLGVPLWLPQGLFVVGLGLFTIALLDDAISILLRKATAFDRAGSELALTE